MKHLIILFLLPLLSLAQNDQDTYLLEHHQYEKGSTQYLFGDHVVLRENPAKDASSLDTLSIGTAVKIIEKTETYGHFQGMDWPWYKVKAGKKSGYVLGGLISFETPDSEGGKYLVSMRHTEENAYARYRYLREDGTFLEGEHDLNTWKFNPEVYDNRGIEGVENILFVSYFAEACGVDGGGIYIFNTGNELKHALSVARVADGGAFWFAESLTFPADEEGMENYIIYKREAGETMDDEMNWTEIQTTIFNLQWIDGRLTPEIPEMRSCE
jgi:hypothetical protein